VFIIFSFGQKFNFVGILFYFILLLHHQNGTVPLQIHQHPLLYQQGVLCNNFYNYQQFLSKEILISQRLFLKTPLKACFLNRELRSLLNVKRQCDFLQCPRPSRLIEARSDMMESSQSHAHMQMQSHTLA
jgi:hypothetical protein